MKTKGLELELTDLNLRALSAPIINTLRWAALARPRRVCRSPLAKKVASLGYKPNPDTWRNVARRFLRRATFARVYVGGHHVALHGAGPVEVTGEMPACIARIVEVGA